MSRSSWIDDQATVRKYRLFDGSSWVVQNEYRPVDCPHCHGQQYCRLTHIWHYDSEGRCHPEWHLNLDTDLKRLKELLVTYNGDVGVAEVEVDGRWVLMKGGERIAVQAL